MKKEQHNIKLREMVQSDKKNLELEFQKDINKLGNDLKGKLTKQEQEFNKNMKELDN